jgi:hypothetical protein
MKIKIYNRDYYTLFDKCCSVIRAMKFNISHSNVATGSVSGLRSIGIPAVIDLRIFHANDYSEITVFPGILTGDFININYDEDLSKSFSENLLYELRFMDEINPFRLDESDLAAALSV